MSTGRLYRTEGIVIRRRDQGEADRVLTLCTPSGKTAVLAKGARKLRSHKAGHIELFTRSSFVLFRMPNYWDIVSQAETVECHDALRGDLLRGSYARYTLELLDRFFTEGEGDPALFALLDHALTWLCEDGELDLIIRFYEQHMLGLAGFRPELFRCVGQHEGHVPLRPHEPTDDERPYGFDSDRGGGLCRDCCAQDERPQEAAVLSPDGLAFLQQCQRRSYTTLREQQVAPPVHEEVERVMQDYITYHLEQGVKAGTFLQRLKRQ